MPSREIAILNVGSRWWITMDKVTLGCEPNGLAAINHMAALETWLEKEELDDETNKIPGIFRDN